MIVGAVVTSAWEFRLEREAQVLSEDRALFSVPAGTVFPYVGAAPGGVVAVLVDLDSPSIAYVAAAAGVVQRCSESPT